MAVFRSCIKRPIFYIMKLYNLCNLVAGVPYNFIFFPIPIFYIFIFFPQNVSPLLYILYLPSSLNIIGKIYCFSFFHNVIFPTAMIFPSPLHNLIFFPADLIRTFVHPWIFLGVYKVPHSPPLGGGSLSNLLGKNIKLWRGEGNLRAFRKNITWKKG